MTKTCEKNAVRPSAHRVPPDPSSAETSIGLRDDRLAKDSPPETAAHRVPPDPSSAETCIGPRDDRLAGTRL